jgi:hypothetical protein
MVDLQDSNKTRIPYANNNDVFSAVLEHHLVGVKVHGKGVTFYPYVQTIQKGANLVIFILLNELKKFYELNKTWPEEIFLQVDGGSEFANKSLLALLELLTVKRMAHRILYTRLPTGHTHEDIDGRCFYLCIFIMGLKFIYAIKIVTN